MVIPAGILPLTLKWERFQFHANMNMNDSWREPSVAVSGATLSLHITAVHGTMKYNKYNSNCFCSACGSAASKQPKAHSRLEMWISDGIISQLCYTFPRDQGGPEAFRS